MVDKIKKHFKKLLYYIRIWFMFTKNAFLVTFSRKLLLGFFLLGKILRFGFFISFLFFLVGGAESLAGYDKNQAVFFFLTFNLIDVISQFLFRNVYSFRSQIVSGDFDLVLSKPISPLFRVLMGGADTIDFITIPPLIFAVYYVGNLIGASYAQGALYVLLIGNGLIIATAFYILVLSIGIITLEIDHTTMIFRDLASMGRFPIDIYKEPLKGILTYLIPIGVMVTIPAKAMFGLVSPIGVVGSLVLGIAMLTVSTRFWSFALKKYTSASS